MWRSASRRTSRHSCSVNSRTSGRLNCAQAVRASGWKRRATTSMVARARSKIGSSSVKERGAVASAIASTSAQAFCSTTLQPARRLCQIAESEAGLPVRPPADDSCERPGQQAQNGGRNRPNPNPSALPEPHHAEHEKRQPRQQDCQQKKQLWPEAPEPFVYSHVASFGRSLARPLACRSPAASPSANARRTSSVGAVRPRRW